jgi:hypothetical protein
LLGSVPAARCSHWSALFRAASIRLPR